MSTGPTSPEDPTRDEHHPGGLAATVIRGAGQAGGGYLLAQTLNLAVYIVLSRLLLPEEFGEYAAATVLVGFGILLTGSGLQAALVQRSDRLEEARSTALAATMIGGLLATLAGVAVAPLLGVLFDSDEIMELALASAALVLVNTLSVVPDSVLQRRFSFLRLVAVDPLGVIVFGTVAIVSASEGMGPWSLVLGQYASFFTNTTLSWVLAGWRPTLRGATVSMWRELVSYGRHVFVATGILRLGEYAADTVVIGKELGTAALGQFRYALRIGSLPYHFLLSAAGFVVFPALARIHGDRDRLNAAFRRSLRWLAAFGLPAGLMLIPLGPATAALVFGDVWLPAGYAVTSMCLYAGGGCIVTAVAETVKATGDPSPLPRLYGLITVVTIGTMVPLAQIDLQAAAASLSIGSLAGAGYALTIARRMTGVDLRVMWADIWPPIIAAVVAALAVLPLDRLVLEPVTHPTVPGLALLAAEAAVFASLYAAGLRVLAPETAKEIWAEARARLPGRTR